MITETRKFAVSVGVPLLVGVLVVAGALCGPQVGASCWHGLLSLTQLTAGTFRDVARVPAVIWGWLA